MAIVFSQALSESDVLNAFNNNIVKFDSDNASPAVKAKITIGSVDVIITPDPSGEFTYNFKTFFETLLNTNNFEDGIVNEVFADDMTPQYVYEDTNLYQSISVTYEVTLESGSTESTSKTYNVTRSLLQLEDYRKGHRIASQSLSLMLPFNEPGANNIFHVTYFEGYPFDLPLWSDAARSIEIRHQGTGLTTNLNVVKGINRIYLSNGSINWSFDDILPLHVGVNHIRIRITGLTSQEMNVYITKKQGECGTLLKWFNQSGGWCYYLFNTHNEERKVKSLGTFNNSAKNLENTVEDVVNLGSASEDEIEVFYSSATPEEKRLINTIFDSPKIYRFLPDPFQNAQEADWVAERIKQGTFETYNKNNTTFEDSFTIEKAERYKMTF